MVHLDFRDARPIYTQIVDGIRTQINAGVLHHGDRLPSVRELAAELTINPNTIQRAYRELEMQGFIATVPGKGCFVCAQPTTQRQDQQPQWEALGKAMQQLQELGITKEEILQFVRQGGKEYA